MDFTPTEEQDDVRGLATQLFATATHPGLAQTGFDDQLWAKLAEAGLLALPVSEELGGAGLPLSVAAFFSNGGRRAYVVRVVPGNAVEADARVRSKTTDQEIETGDGVVVAFIFFAALFFFCREVVMAAGSGAFVVFLYFFAVASTSVSLSAKSPVFAIMVMLTFLLGQRSGVAARNGYDGSLSS